MGDLPLFVVSDKSLLKGTGAGVVVKEVVKGVDVAFEAVVDGLVPGQDYYVRAFARNENGYGTSTGDLQQDGKGALPLLTSVAISPDAPGITGLWPVSGSQLELRLSSPVDHGDPISKYLFEYAVGDTFGTPAIKKLLSVTRAVYVLTGEPASLVISFSTSDNRLTTTPLTASQSQLLVNGAVLNVGGKRFIVRAQPLKGSEHGSNGYEWTISFDNNLEDVVHGSYPACTAWVPNVAVYGQIHTVKYEGACTQGQSGIQTIIADASTRIGGTFTLSYMGKQTEPLLFEETGASEMRAALDSITASGTVNVSISRYGPYGKAWHVTFVQEEEDQDAIFIQHSHLTGQNALISVYPTVTVFTDAKQNDISGSFRISFGGETTEAIGYAATHSKVTQELQKLSSVDSVLALGDMSAGDIGVYALKLIADTSSRTISNIKLSDGTMIDPTRFLAIGETLVIGTDPANTILSMTSIDITLSNTVSTAVGVQILAGLITKQTKALPGYVGISYLMQVISVENGLKVFELPASHGYNQYDTFFVAEVEFIVANVNGAQVTTTQPYNGESVVGASPTLYLFDNKLRTTEDLTTLVKNGDDLWLRSGSADMVKYTVTDTDPRYLKVSGSFTSSITREHAYHVANGRKWNLVFRSYHGNLGTIDAVPAFDWRGTEARIGTRNPKSVSPNVVNVGNPASTQTIILEIVNVAITTTYTLSFAGETKPLASNIPWSTVDGGVKTALESLDSVDGVSVTSVCN
ncbi:hypothetical protein BBP00_00009663 [Phytophthora kernoviae]|uniref:Fibronectin type-III domain-containing protein n=1 Tax=Phytophthora kernoviae TaxID=325452 RepID=A0A3F2RBY6_9STRA|nr:hypothetical protein BBP00_00009663 [Phytophthora kernoviae]